MTRRPLLPRSARVKRTTHARTPSAKKSSESPVARLGPRRKPRTAASAPQPPMPPEYLGMTYVNQGDQAYPSGVLELDDDYSWPLVAYSAGDIAVAFIGARGATSLTLPSGWNSLASGVVGDLRYAAAWRRLTGTDDWSVTVSPSWDSTVGWSAPGDYAGYVDAMVPIFVNPTLTPTLTTVTKDTSSFAFAPTGSGVGVSHWWMPLRSVEDGNATEPSHWPTGSNVWPDIIAMGGGAYTLAPGDATGEFMSCNYSCDWATYALGWE